MRIATLYAPGDVRLEETPVPFPVEDEVLVEIRAAGICGSDLHRYRGLDPWGGQLRVPQRGGHEIAGVVVRPGRHARSFAEGQAVAIEPMQLAGCGQCVPCRRGHSNICANPERVLHRRTSCGFAEFDVATVGHTFACSNRLPAEQAALADVYACALHALHRSAIGSGDRVLIIGTGPLGFAVGQLARLTGATVLIMGRREAALRRAISVGACDESMLCGDARTAHADLVFEAVGGADSVTLQLALDAVVPGGTITLLGAFAGDVHIPYRKANRKEITLRWSNGYSTWNGTREFRIALDLLASGRVDAAGLITHRFPLSEISDAFATAEDKLRSNAIKVTIISPGGNGAGGWNG
jgi:L-iditol 2-dehydrogenase